MEDKTILLAEIDKLHTTKMGIERIRKNLNLDEVDVIAYCKEKILDQTCVIEKKGKNWYCTVGPIKITIHAQSHTVITAHRME